MRVFYLAPIVLLALAATSSCSSSSSSDTSGGSSGHSAVCGDGEVTSPEVCDDGNIVAEACAYGEASCAVCDGACRLVPGATSACGDAVVDGARGEMCDDGNADTEVCAYGEVSCEVCDAACHRVFGAPSFCGDGTLDASSGETCDDGNTLLDGCAYGQTSCSVCGPDCQSAAGLPSFCGDGVVDGKDGEACDDGNLTDGDGCDSTCTPTGCGNGVVSGAELCDDGNLMSGDGCDASCLPTGCGSGILTAGELCDDGNLVDGDGCDSNCTPTGCGNGIVATGETCDDGNTTTETCPYGSMTPCTVCNAGCQLVPGAVKYCGDGLVDPGNSEECEDGNVVDGDGCEADCTFACGSGSGADAAYLTSTGCTLYFANQTSWFSAQSTCANVGYSLVSIPTLARNAALSAFVAGNKVWIGLNDQAVEGTFAWENGDPVNFSRWSGGEPNAGTSGEDCVERVPTSYWNDQDCLATRRFLCEKTTCGDGVLDANEVCDDGNLADGDGCDSTCTPTACGNGVVSAGEDCDDGNFIDGDGCESTCLFSCGSGSGASAAHVFGGHCYLLYETQADWTAAEQNCVSVGGHLVTIDDAAENAFVLSLITIDTHIGFSDAATEGSFVWLSGSAVSYTNWGGSEPNNSGGAEDCAQMRASSGLWNDVSCAAFGTSMCEI